ncbi:hypothetical protein K0U83_18135 [bacterium]|nr:hypothetical protein [bacterium]
MGMVRDFFKQADVAVAASDAADADPVDIPDYSAGFVVSTSGTGTISWWAEDPSTGTFHAALDQDGTPIQTIVGAINTAIATPDPLHSFGTVKAVGFAGVINCFFKG